MKAQELPLSEHGLARIAKIVDLEPNSESDGDATEERIHPRLRAYLAEWCGGDPIITAQQLIERPKKERRLTWAIVLLVCAFLIFCVFWGYYSVDYVLTIIMTIVMLATIVVFGTVGRKEISSEPLLKFVGWINEVRCTMPDKYPSRQTVLKTDIAQIRADAGDHVRRPSLTRNAATDKIRLAKCGLVSASS